MLDRLLRRIVLILATAVLALVAAADAQTGEELAALNKRGAELFKAGKYAEALAARRILTAVTEKAETREVGKPGRKTAAAFGTLAWYALFAREFGEALGASERAHGLAPELLWIETNRAHALLFVGRTDDARALYL